MKKQLQIKNKGKKRCDLVGKMISKLKGLTTDSYARQHGVKTDKAFTRERSFSLAEFIRYMLIF
ncbi:MAG: hypothetical protein ACRC6X_05800, partial [Culicoidibacterales bacterium]